MRRKLIPIPARLSVLMLLALLTVSFLPSYTPPACAGNYNDTVSRGGSGGPDDPSGNPTGKTIVTPKDPTLSVSVTPPSQHQQGDGYGSHDASWVSRMLQAVRLALQGYFHLS